ncbi:MAG: flagellar hook-associated protein FlgK [Angelakisella sp.]
MRPTFMGFETAKRGLMVNQKALDIVGNNIGNMGVTGYTRQRVDQVSLSTQGMTSRYSLEPHILAGQGSAINGVSQVRDPYLDKRYRQEFADVGKFDKMTEVLTDVETALDEYESDGGMATAIQKMFKAIESMSMAGGNTTTNANIVRTSAKSMTQVLKQFDVKLNNVIDQQKYDLELNVDHVNSLLERVASLNESIQRDMFSAEGGKGSYFGPNELLDERNVLLDELSKFGDINVQTKTDGTVTVKMGTHEVVSGTKAETVSYVKNDDNTVSVTWQSTGKDVELDTGSIFASIAMINGRGPAATAGTNENYERGVPYYKDQIDTMAKTIASAFNGVIPEMDANGEPIKDKLGNVTYKQLFTFEDGKKQGAGSITITEAWDKDSTYMMTPTSADGKDDNKYYLSMISLFKNDIDFGNGFKGTMEGYVKNYNTTLSEDKTFNTSRLSASAAISDNLLDSISQVSGVSMDEEGADMMAYNKVYAAMGRIMTSLDEALDVLINRTGVVGR